MRERPTEIFLKKQKLGSTLAKEAKSAIKRVLGRPQCAVPQSRPIESMGLDRIEVNSELLASCPKAEAQISRPLSATAPLTIVSASKAVDSAYVKLEVSAFSRDEFLALLHSELQTPLEAAISAASILLDNEAYSDMDPGLRNWIQFIKKNVDAVMHLKKDVVDMERVAAGHPGLNLKVYCMEEIVEESVAMFCESATKKGIHLRILPAHDPVFVRGDRDRLGQIIGHLIKNAVNFTPSLGSILVQLSQTETEVHVSVRDNGVGIPEEQQRLVFERFQKVDGVTRRGPGLGLYVTKMWVEAQGGRLWFKTSRTKGSDFTFSLPKVDA